MKLHEMSIIPGSKKKRNRVGRGIGSGNGKTAGKGMKGQNSRSGGGVRPLVEAGILKNVRDGVRILGNGELERKLTVVAQGFTKSAQQKIEAAGGKVEVI